MSLLAHLIAADVQRLRWAVAGWVAVTVVATSWQAGAPFLSAQTGPYRPLDTIMGVAWFAQLITGATLVPLVVHGHPAVGTTAFWMTRPFPHRTLAASKVLLLFLLFVLVPALCDAVLMTIYRVPAGSQLLALIQASVQRMLIVLIGAGIAAMTATFARFVLTIGIAIAAIVAMINLSMLVELGRDDGFYTVELAISNGAQVWASSRVPTPLPVAVMALVATIIAAAVVFVQYGRRSRPRSLGVAAAGALVVASLGWALPDASRDVESPTWAEDPARSRLVARGSTMHFDGDPFSNWEGPRAAAVARGDVVIENIPEGWLAAARLRAATLQVTDGPSIESRRHGFGAVLPSADERSPISAAVARLLGVDTVVGNGGDEPNQAVLLALPRAQAPPVGTVGHYRGTFDIELTRISVAATLPLDRSSTFQDGAHRFTLVQSTLSEMGPRLRVRMSDAEPALDSSPGRSYYYYLRNRSAKQAIGGHHPHWGTSLVGVLPLGNVYVAALLPFSARSDEFLFPALSPQSRKMSIDEEWMRHADLVVLKVEQAGTIERTLEIPQLQVGARRRQ